MNTNDYDIDFDEAPAVKTKRKLSLRQPKKEKEVENDLFDESETSCNERKTFPKVQSDGGEENSIMEDEVEETEDGVNDPLNEIIPCLESIQEGIYYAKITSVKSTKNDNVMVCFSLNVDNQFYYPLFSFFPRNSIKGNPTYLLLKAFDDIKTSFNGLIKKTIIVSVKIVKKDGKVYENVVDFASEEYDITSLEVDKYGRFIF